MSSDLVTLDAATGTQRDLLLECRRDPVRHPRLCYFNQAEAADRLRPILLKAYLYRGQKPDDEVVAFTANELAGELLRDADGLGLHALSIDEVAYVVRKAVLGQGGELYGITIASLYRSLADYAKGEGHALQVEAERTAKAAEGSTVADFIESAAETFAKQKNINQKHYKND